jgi:signal transduction histidine kinase
VDACSVSDAEFQNIVDNNNRLCVEDGLQYVWSVLVLKDRIVFTSATSPDHIVTNRLHAKFFETHTDPPAFAGALQAMAPHFSTFKNVWGWGRMVLIPERDRQGRIYMFGASVAVTELQHLARQTIVQSLSLGALVLLTGILLSLLLSRSLSVPLAQASKAAQNIAAGDLRQPLDLRGAAEIRALSKSLTSMRDAIRLQMDSLRQEIALRRQTEQELEKYRQHLEELVAQRTAELAEANAELEAFSSSVSHDLRAPLRAIDGICLTLLEDYGDRFDETGKELFGRVRAGAQRMGRLIDDLLRLAKVGRGGIRRETVNLSELAAALEREVRQSNPTRAVRFEIAPDLRVSGDRELLQIMLSNLLANAWKFTSKTPEARIEFGVQSEAGEPVYYVRDNGAGFDMAFADKLFQPFQRLHAPHEFAGSGIGLALAQRIVNRHGGRLWAQGAVGRGATFFFTLERRDSSAAKNALRAGV